MAPNETEACAIQTQRGESYSLTEIDRQTTCFVAERSGHGAHEGSVLKEHDYFSASGRREKSFIRKGLDLNVTETELRLGPPPPTATADGPATNTEANAASQGRTSAQSIGEKAEETGARAPRNTGDQDGKNFIDKFQSGGSQKKEPNGSATHEFVAPNKLFHQEPISGRQSLDHENALHSQAALELDQARRTLMSICPGSKLPYIPPSNVVSGTKRVFIEALGSGSSEGRVGFPSPGKFAAIPVGLAQQGELISSPRPHLPASPIQAKVTNASSYSPWKLGLQPQPFTHADIDQACGEGETSLCASRSKMAPNAFPAEAQSCEVKPDTGHSTKEQATEFRSRAPVGWPPVQSFRKNSLPAAPHSKGAAVQTKDKLGSSGGLAAAAVATGAAENNTQPLLVKVHMDGLPIGRKVDLKVHSSYNKLSFILEEMFRKCLSGSQAVGPSPVTKRPNPNEGRNLNFLCGSEYVITYEDKDGDLMLMGDVPWEMFIQTVKRLRIMRGSEAIGLAPQLPNKNKVNNQHVHCN